VIKYKWLFSFIILLIYTIFSIASIAIIPAIFSSVESSIVLLFFTLLLNIGIASIIKKRIFLKENWTLRKFHFFGIGFLFWTIMLAIGFLLKCAFGGTSEINTDISIYLKGMYLTLIVVSWEELLFRGIILNYVHQYSNKIFISLVMGGLFMIAHLLNPEFDFLRQAPNLFFAGYLFYPFCI